MADPVVGQRGLIVRVYEDSPGMFVERAQLAEGREGRLFVNGEAVCGSGPDHPLCACVCR